MHYPVKRFWTLWIVVIFLCSGCVQSADTSGWELVPKKGRTVSMQVFPDIPVILPVPVSLPSPAALKPATATPIEGMILRKLDEGSLFRRGYSAPTP